jgi:myosin heavy subunit
VGCVNAALAPPPHQPQDGPAPKPTLLGVLDIYGFEILAGNGLVFFILAVCFFCIRP